ncbi:MAG: hypothetical protein K0R94_1163, partial [Burkholderiales bacterium]|nr:hypothetical protein [Burkholderiales bacterium]
MRYLKRSFFLPLFFFLFIINGCSNGSRNNQQISAHSLQTESSLQPFINSKPDNFFSIRNDTGKKITRISAALSNGELIYNEEVNCSKKCKINIEENKIKGNLKFKFFYSNAANIDSYFWAYGNLRKVAIGSFKSPQKFGGPVMCDHLTDDSAVGALSTMASIFPPPYNYGLGFLFSIGKGAIDEACLNGNGSISDTINALSYKVAELQNEMTRMQYGIEGITQEIAIQDISDVLTQFKSDILVLQESIEEYNNIFDESGSYTGLVDYVQGNGGFLKVYKVNKHFDNAILSTKAQVDNFNKLLLFRLDDLEQKLQSTFSDPTIMVGDVVNLRVKANLIINYFAEQVDIYKTTYSLMLNDERDVIKAALDDGSINNDWL